MYNMENEISEEIRHISNVETKTHSSGKPEKHKMKVSVDFARNSNGCTLCCVRGNNNIGASLYLLVFS